MSSTDAPPDPAAPAAHGRQVAVSVLVGIGLLAALIGMVVGFRAVLAKTIADCPDGTVWPPGVTDFRCYTHPHALEGSAIALVSLMLGILIWILGVVADTLLSGHRPTG